MKNKLLQLVLLPLMFLQSPSLWSTGTGGKNMLMQEMTLVEAIAHISRDYNVYFTFDHELVKDIIVEYESRPKRPVEEAISGVLIGTDLKFKLYDKRFVILYQNDEKGLESLKELVKHFEHIIADGPEKSAVHQNLKPVASIPIREVWTPPARKLQNFAINVSGTVTDQEGESLIGVNVQVKGTNKGAATDFEGHYEINDVDGNAILVFSYVGYQRQEIPVDGRSTVDVTMLTDAQLLEQVVVVGYGEQKKETVVGAVSQVNNEELFKSGAPNITNALAGKLPGVLTIQQTGEPGQNQSEILIRGLSSWSGSAPLVMIDGIERDFQEIDPNEINTISVLKDASATAVFGSKGANGVILVTTKRGKLGKPKLSVTASTGIQVPTRIPEFIDSYTTMSMRNVALMNSQQFTELTSDGILNEYQNPSTPLKGIQYPNVDWFEVNTKEFASASNANINVSGGTDFIKYFASLGYSHEGSYFKQPKEGYLDSRFWYNRFNYRSNIDFNLSKTSIMSINVGGDLGIKNSPPVNYYGWRAFYGSTGAVFPAYYPAWVLEQLPDIDYPEASEIRRAEDFGETGGNPYNLIYDSSFDRYQKAKLFTDVVFDQKLDFFIKGLSLKGKFAYNTYYQNRALYARYSPPTYKILWDKVKYDADGNVVVEENPWFRNGQGTEYYYPEPFSIGVGGYGVQGTSGTPTGVASEPFSSDIYYEGSINYRNSFGKNYFTGLALINRQQKNRGTEYPFFNEAFAGRLTYDYSNKYLVEINIGYTGSEQFAPGNRYGFFPAGAIGWVLSEENFVKDALPWMNKLKLRYSDGLVGSDYAQNRWLYISDYWVDPRGYIHQDLGANEFAQWEESRKKDLGIEVGIFNNKFTFTIDLYDEYRDKMLIAPRTVTFLVGNSFKELNLGSLKKHGIDFEFEFNKMTANNFNYFIKGNLGFNENRVLFRDDPEYTPDYLKYKGKSLGAQLNGVIRTGTGYFTTVDDLHINPSPLIVENTYVGDYKFLDFNSDGVIDSRDNYPIKGETYAPIGYSISGGLNFKGFDFSLMFQGNSGKYERFGPVDMVEFYKGTPRVHTPQLNYWRPDNQNATHSTLHISGADGGDAIHTWGSNAFDGIFWRNSAYVRLKEIHAGYTFANSDFLKQLGGISSLLVYLNASNVLTFSKLLKDYDPEVLSQGSGWYPQLSRYQLGVRFGF